jgi:glycosyltransferase involved in cell wall biosynthesis
MKLLALDQDAILAGDRGMWRALNGSERMEVTLAVPLQWKEGDTLVSAEREMSTMRVVQLRSLLKGKHHRALYPGLSKLVRSERPDLLFVNAEPESFLSAQAALATRRLKIPLIFMTWRNIDYGKGGFPYKLAFLNDAAEQYVLRVAGLCISRNGEGAEILRRKGFRNVAVIPPAVDTNLFSFHSRTGHVDSNTARKFTIGYVGRIVPEKGVDMLLRAAAGLQVSFQLVIVGNGPQKKELQSLAMKLSLSERIAWIHHVPHPEVPNLLYMMDVLVLPSRTTRTWKEQFGRVLVEAMACGTAVVGSDSGEIPPVIGEAGLVFREGNVEDLREKLGILVHSDVREKLITKGLRLVEQRYSIPVIARKWLETLQAFSRDVTPVV